MNKLNCALSKEVDISTTVGMSSYDEKKSVFEDIKLLAKPEQEELFRIIRRMKENYTENSNGIFFDLTLISDQTFDAIKEYLHFCLRTRQEHETRLKELEIIRMSNEQYTDMDQSNKNDDETPLE